MGAAVVRQVPPNAEKRFDDYSCDRPSAPASSNLPPSAFICAITQELMTNPVSVASGHSYERSAIESWFERGKMIDPVTGLPLPTTTVVPNIRLRMAIEEWKEEQASKQHESRGSNAGSWVIVSSNNQPVRCGPSNQSSKVNSKRPGEILTAESILNFDGGWLKLTDSESQYLRISDGKRTYAARIPELD